MPVLRAVLIFGGGVSESASVSAMAPAAEGLGGAVRPPFGSLCGTMPATTHIGARIDTGLVGRFGLLAARAGRSFSRELEAAMRDHLAHAEQRERISRMSLDELDTYLAGVDDRPSA